MITEIEHLQMPDWLKKDIFSFNIKEVLTDSLYYPCSHFDGKPVTHLMGNVYSFIYVDYGVSKDDFCNEVNNHGFDGYHTIYSESIGIDQLVPNGWNVHVTPDESEINRLEMGYIREWIKEPFCEWMIFERDTDKDETYNPKRFSLLFLCAEGAASYQALYLSNNIAPKILAIIRPGHGFGGNYTDFRNKDKILARSVFYNESKLPEYILIDSTSEPLWEEYAEAIWSTANYFTSMKLWKINKKSYYGNES